MPSLLDCLQGLTGSEDTCGKVNVFLLERECIRTIAAVMDSTMELDYIVENKEYAAKLAQGKSPCCLFVVTWYDRRYVFLLCRMKNSHRAVMMVPCKRPGEYQHADGIRGIFIGTYRCLLMATSISNATHSLVNWIDLLWTVHL